MANKDYAILDIQNDDDELQFQDFGLSGSSNGQTRVFPEHPDSPGRQTDQLLAEYRDDDETAGDGKSGKKALSLWTFEYYQRFFDVDSRQVGDRIVWSMVPKPGVSFLEVHVRPKPDLYGPFWVCLTLVFAAAIAGNVSNFLQTQEATHWRYEFHKVSLAACMVFSYSCLLPLLLWSVLRSQQKQPCLSLVELLCLYGYSLSALVPVCLVWTVPVLWLRWCVGFVGVVLSGLVLARAVWTGLKGRPQAAGAAAGEEDEEESETGVMKKVAVVMTVVVVVMHVAIAMGFMLYFFNEPMNGGIHGTSVPLAAAGVTVSIAPPATTGPPLAGEKAAVSPTKRDTGRDVTAAKAGEGPAQQQGNGAPPETGGGGGAAAAGRGIKLGRESGKEERSAVTTSVKDVGDEDKTSAGDGKKDVGDDDKTSAGDGKKDVGDDDKTSTGDGEKDVDNDDKTSAGDGRKHAQKKKLAPPLGIKKQLVKNVEERLNVATVQKRLL